MNLGVGADDLASFPKNMAMNGETSNVSRNDFQPLAPPDEALFGVHFDAFPRTSLQIL